MATYEKKDDNTVEVTETTTVSKEVLEKELAHLNRNIAHKITRREKIETQLGLLNQEEI